MKNKKLITIGIIILLLSVFIKVIFVGIRNINVDDFQPAAVIFVVDTSTLNQVGLQERKNFLRQICTQLDPEDEIKIIKVSQDSYLIYEGSPQNNNGIMKSIDTFGKNEDDDTGAAYGEGFKKAFSYALLMQKEGYIPSIVVMGTLENKGAVEKQLNWDTLPKNVKNIKKYSPNISMMFLFAHPQKLDTIKVMLSPILGEQKLIVATEQNADNAVRKFINVLRH